MTSRIPGFRGKSGAGRIKDVSREAGLSAEDVRVLESDGGITFEQADKIWWRTPWGRWPSPWEWPPAL